MDDLRLYRLIVEDAWKALSDGPLPLGDADKRDGYVHLSFQCQVEETARRHYAHASALLALEIDRMAIAADLRIEFAPSRGEKFPHLYAPLLRRHVVAVCRLRRDAAGLWRFDRGFEGGSEI